MVDRTKLYEGNRPNPRIPSPTPALPSGKAAHTNIRPKAQPTPKRTPVNTSHTKVYVTPPPAIPGHEHAPISTVAGTGGSVHTPIDRTPTKSKPPTKPVNPPTPKGGTPPKAAPRPTPKAPSGGTNPAPPTSSPAPNTGPSQGTGGGFDLGSFLPLLLIAGAILAGLYLYTHRKG